MSKDKGHEVGDLQGEGEFKFLFPLTEGVKHSSHKPVAAVGGGQSLSSRSLTETQHLC